MTLTARPPCHRPAPGPWARGPQVPLVTGGTAEYANLDLAASAPALEAVAAHVADVLPLLSSVHRGAGYLSQVSTALLERARECVGEFVGAPASDDVVVFTRNTTDALNLLATAVPGAGRCASTSSTTPTCCPGAPGRTARCPRPRRSRRRSPISTPRCAPRPTALLAVTGASNVTGEVLPLDRIVAIAHAAGARVAVDAAQLAPHRRVDLAATGVDYVALSGHKLYAPFGAGALVGRRDWLDAAAPYLAGGGAVTRVDLDDATWAPAPHRHEAGTPNVLGIAALAQACRTLAPVLDGAGARPRAARCSTGSPRAWRTVPGRHARCGSGPTARTGWRCRASPSPATPRATSRRTCRPSTASACATAGSAPTRCSSGCAGPARTATDRGPGEHRARHHGRARRPAGRRPAHAGHPGSALDLRAGRRPLDADAGPARPRPARCRPPGTTGTGCGHPA